MKNLKMTKEDVDQIWFVRYHRKGKPNKSGIGTIICRFDYFGDMEGMKRLGFDLQGIDTRMSEDFPPEVVV